MNPEILSFVAAALPTPPLLPSCACRLPRSLPTLAYLAWPGLAWRHARMDAEPATDRARGSTPGPQQGAAGARRPSNPEDPHVTHFARSVTHMRAALPILRQSLPRVRQRGIRRAARVAQGDARGARVTARAHCSGQVLLCACARCAR